VDPRLEAQHAYLRSDERLIERARAALELSVEERLAVMARLCAEAAAYPRLDEREPLPPDAEAALRRLGQGA
jgi:hypothetical protein